MVDDRKLAVLRAIVTDYVRSREPVGSRALVERHRLDVSPATIRNDMAALEDEGYIAQPHTSAGRVPTDKGYRLFVDRLAQVKPLSRAERCAIAAFLTGAVDLDDIVTRTVRLLAKVTSQVAIVQYPVVVSAVIRQVDLIRLNGPRGLVVLVNSAGAVRQHHVDLGDCSDEDLGALRQRLNQAVVGLTPGQAAARLGGLVEQVEPSLRGLAANLAAGLADLLVADPSTRVVVGGVGNLARFTDQFETAIKPVLEALEEQVVLLRLLGEATSEVTVRIGQENEHANLTAASVVASRYGDSDETWASLGVVGPTSMDYPSTMASVRAVARYVSQILAEG
ncbi:MAG: heat-inducible transcriptional repressor HrcA [Propionibacteriaceae bacterium]|jgi:heat-inducible transcriptional repressor|nr:heat-inducible transcriptional repressor HrcA [Propionibacteriaceae bacterium]